MNKGTTGNVDVEWMVTVRDNCELGLKRTPYGGSTEVRWEQWGIRAPDGVTEKTSLSKVNA